MHEPSSQFMNHHNMYHFDFQLPEWLFLTPSFLLLRRRVNDKTQLLKWDLGYTNFTKEVFVELSLPCWVIFLDGSRKGEDDVWVMPDSLAVPDGDLGHLVHRRSAKVRVTLTSCRSSAIHINQVQLCVVQYSAVVAQIHQLIWGVTAKPHSFDLK